MGLFGKSKQPQMMLTAEEKTWKQMTDEEKMSSFVKELTLNFQRRQIVVTVSYRTVFGPHDSVFDFQLFIDVMNKAGYFVSAGPRYSAFFTKKESAP